MNAIKSETEVMVPYGQSLETEWDPLRAYWKVVVQHRLLVILVFLGVVGLAAYITFSATPLYTASTILRIDPQNPTVVKIEEVQTPYAAEGAQYGDYYQTQLALLKSRTLAARVIVDLGLERNQAFTGNYTADSGPLTWLYSKLSGLLRVAFSRKETTPPITQPELGVDSTLIDQYLDLLEVQPISNTRLVQIDFTSPDPRLSQDVANAHAGTFIRMNLETRFELTGEAREFLEKKLSELKVKVEQSEAALNRFRQKQKVLSLQGNENIIVERMVDLNKRLTEAKAKRIETESLAQVVENKDPTDLALVIDNPMIQQLKTQIGTLEAEAARLLSTFEPAYPPLAEMTQQIEELRRRLGREVAKIVHRIKSDYAAARAQEEALQAEADRQQQTALDLKARGADYIILEAALESSRALYNDVLKRANETNVSGDLTVANIQVTDRAETPLTPSSPRKRRNLLGAAAIGLFLGCGLALFREYLDSSIKTPQDIWQATALPTLGVVPHLRHLRRNMYGYGYSSHQGPTHQLTHAGGEGESALSKELAFSHHPLSIISESYRAVRTALLLSQPERPPQVILLTSCHPSEGKTVTTLNLAISLAQDGHAVLVIDADLRKGRCHKLFNMRNHRGLSNVLTGNLTLEEGVQQTMVGGLSFLSRGEIPPNPAELLGSRKMKQIVEELRNDFSFILIDSPPVLGVSDATVLSALCDGVLVVVRGQETTAPALSQAVEQLSSLHAKILGVVLNAVDIRSNPDYAYYRYYYKSYYMSRSDEQ